MPRLLHSVSAFLIVVWLCQTSQADFFVLYDGNGLPSNQSWLSYFSNGAFNGGIANQSQISTGVRLQTDSPVSAGYGSYLPTAQLKNAAFPSLNRANGFELSFSLAVTSESHSSDDRAGFSVTLLGSDAKGIELGFWNSQVWAQNAAFTHAESAVFDTTQPTNYRLRIENETYSLFTGNAPLLSGSVRDYSLSGIPYSLPNMLFLGDNTSRGEADVSLGAITLQSNLSAVPEPSSILMILVCIGLPSMSASVLRGKNKNRQMVRQSV